nr:NADH dehydrogenase subunit 6 [Typodryas sp. N143]
MFFIWLNLALSMVFMFVNHPLSFGLILVLQTIAIAIMTGMMNFSFWFSYIIFLVMIGGMLVLFMYMTSVASNEKFKMSYFITLFLVCSIPFSIMITLAEKFMNLEFNIKLEETLNFEHFTQSHISLMKYFNLPHSSIYLLMIIYLLVSLIMVVKITNIKYGPLRQNF